jgi:hypothetical protein
MTEDKSPPVQDSAQAKVSFFSLRRLPIFLDRLVRFFIYTILNEEGNQGKQKEVLFATRYALRTTHYEKKGDTYLLSHILANVLPSALGSLTAVFGMETGVASPV